MLFLPASMSVTKNLLSATIIHSQSLSPSGPGDNFSLSACLHNTSETAAQAECRVKLATMLRCSRQSQFHWILFLCEIHKSTILFVFIVSLFTNLKKSVDFLFISAQTHFLKQYPHLRVILKLIFTVNSSNSFSLRLIEVMFSSFPVIVLNF